MHFVVETREKFQFEMNGWRLSFRDEGYWVDVSFRKMMVGEFAVEQRKNEFVLSERPQVLREDNWVEQGYPFFCGSIIEQD